MSSNVLNLTFDRLPLPLPAGYDATVERCAVLPGPGRHRFGNYPVAYDFSAQGWVELRFAHSPVRSLSAFCVRILFLVPEPVTETQVLAQCNAIPFQLRLEPDETDRNSDFLLTAKVNDARAGFIGPDTGFRRPLSCGVWYGLEVAYRTDTLGVFFDGRLELVHAFPLASPALGAGEPRLGLGSAVTGGIVHTLQTGGGELHYAINGGDSELLLHGSGGAQETLTVTMRHDGGAPRIRFQPQREQHLTLTHFTRLGLNGDGVKMVWEGLAVSPEAGLELRIRPWLGEIELVTGREQRGIPLVLSGRIAGAPFHDAFRLDLAHGAHIDPAGFVTHRRLYATPIREIGAPLAAGAGRRLPLLRKRKAPAKVVP